MIKTLAIFNKHTVIAAFCHRSGSSPHRMAPALPGCLHEGLPFVKLLMLAQDLGIVIRERYHATRETSETS
jgi:hypothetical protein